MSDQPRNSLVNEDIILLSNQMLEDRYWTSKQYITQVLKRSNRVLYVEGNYSFGKLLLGIFRRSWPVHPFGKLRHPEKDLWVLTPPPRMPLRNHLRLMGWLNQWLLKMKISNAVKRIGFQNPVLWTFLHQTGYLIGKFHEKVSVYHCVDDWPERLAMEKMGARSLVVRDENDLIKRVDLVFRVSEVLLEGREKVGAPVHLTPNGVDMSAFHLNRASGFKDPEDLIKLKKPVLGFAGSLGEWVDADLIIKVAQGFPTASIVLIGQIDRGEMLDRLLAEPNIYYLGMKPRIQVPDYLNGFDVCLMPFARNRIGQGLLPLKMFQYLAMGKPVVATSSPPLRSFSDVVALADDPDEFVDKIKAAIKLMEPELVQARMHRAQEYSWENRIKVYADLIRERIEQSE